MAGLLLALVSAVIWHLVMPLHLQVPHPVADLAAHPQLHQELGSPVRVLLLSVGRSVFAVVVAARRCDSHHVAFLLPLLCGPSALRIDLLAVMAAV